MWDSNVFILHPTSYNQWVIYISSKFLVLSLVGFALERQASVLLYAISKDGASPCILIYAATHTVTGWRIGLTAVSSILLIMSVAGTIIWSIVFFKTYHGMYKKSNITTIVACFSAIFPLKTVM